MQELPIIIQVLVGTLIFVMIGLGCVIWRDVLTGRQF